MKYNCYQKHIKSAADFGNLYKCERSLTIKMKLIFITKTLIVGADNCRHLTHKII